MNLINKNTTAKFKKCAWYPAKFKKCAWYLKFGMFAVDYMKSRHSDQNISELCADGTLFTKANDAITEDIEYLHSQGFSDKQIAAMEAAGVNTAQARLAYNGKNKDEFIDNVLLKPEEEESYVIGQVGDKPEGISWKDIGKVAASVVMGIGAGTVAANEYPFTDLTEYSYTNTWMSGDQTNKLIINSVRGPLEGGVSPFQVIVNNLSDETFNEARHYGSGFLFGNADGWSSEITNTNFLRFYNGLLHGGNQQVFIDGSSLTQANQVAIMPFEMDNDEGGSRTGYALGPQVPEPIELALLLIGAGLLSAKRKK